MANKITIIREEKADDAVWYDHHLESTIDYDTDGTPRTEGLHPHVIEESHNLDESWPTTDEVKALGEQMIVTSSDNWAVYKEVKIKCTDTDPVIFSDPKREGAAARDAYNEEHGITTTITTVDADEDWFVVE